MTREEYKRDRAWIFFDAAVMGFSGSRAPVDRMTQAEIQACLLWLDEVQPGWDAKMLEIRGQDLFAGWERTNEATNLLHHYWIQSAIACVPGKVKNWALKRYSTAAQ